MGLALSTQLFVKLFLGAEWLLVGLVALAHVRQQRRRAEAAKSARDARTTDPGALGRVLLSSGSFGGSNTKKAGDRRRMAWVGAAALLRAKPRLVPTFCRTLNALALHKLLQLRPVLIALRGASLCS